MEVDVVVDKGELVRGGLGVVGYGLRLIGNRGIIVLLERYYIDPDICGTTQLTVGILCIMKMWAKILVNKSIINYNRLIEMK